MDLELAKKSEHIGQSERAYSEVKVEYDALAAANDSLRQEIRQTREKAASEQKSSQLAEAETSSLQAQMRMKELDHGAEVSKLRDKIQAVEAALEQCKAAIEGEEAATAATRADS